MRSLLLFRDVIKCRVRGGGGGGEGGRNFLATPEFYPNQKSWF
jgi:hypothetical protein